MDPALSQEVLLDHFKNPRHRGKAASPALSGAGVNPACGDRVEVTATLDQGRLSIQVEGAGCVISQASASMMAQVLQGESADGAKAKARMVRDWISGRGAAPDFEAMADLEALEGVRRHPSRVKCACLAWTVFLDISEGR